MPPHLPPRVGRAAQRKIEAVSGPGRPFFEENGVFRARALRVSAPNRAAPTEE
jgi:hypothetical protein